MVESRVAAKNGVALSTDLSTAARDELDALGVYRDDGSRHEHVEGVDRVVGRAEIPKRPTGAREVLNEAYDYRPRPSSFSRGMRVELPGATMIFLSGTASVDEHGATLYAGDFQAQCLRTYRNLTRLLIAEGASWHDVVRTSCYLRDIERDYDTFNEIRTFFFEEVVGLDPLPASTGIQARLCRSDLLVEMEAIAIVPQGDAA
ncbi:MAG: Rid family hydrolase [Acidobacteriota bacterium]|jgi:enamine deaminase RidA (YjgF/YER057c/UK114 family)